MLTHQVLTRQDIGDVAAYYGDGADDYYAKEGEAQVWQGKGAEALGLTGEVSRDRFRDLLAGRIDPDGPGVRISTRDDSKNRIGIDLTFSAPKSVSILALVGGDKAMIEAHDLAVQKTLEYAETYAAARIKENGKSRVERTGNLIIAKFRHETTRAQDPELHTHAVVMNLTQRADGEWRALRNDEIIKMTRYLGAVYRNELAQVLERQGHALRYGRDGTFDLASMSRQQIAAFSRRSAQIEAYLAARGLTLETANQSERQMATMKTRARKDSELDREALYQEWRQRAAELRIALGTGAGQGARQAPPAHEYGPDGLDGDSRYFMQVEAARAAVRFAINHLSEREAVLSRNTLVNTALQHQIGRTDVRAISEAIEEAVSTGRLVEEEPQYHAAKDTPRAARGREQWIDALMTTGLSRAEAEERFEQGLATRGLIQREGRYTTNTGIAREQQVLAIEKAGRGAVMPLMSPEAAAAHFKGEQLNAGQKSAASLILSTSNRVVGIEGLAGTGKSHMLDKAKNKILALANDDLALQGYTFRALAPYGTQARALRGLGVQASTVASFLKAKDKKMDERTVLVVDEAAVLPARQMAQLLSIVEKSGARVALVFDRAQTKAIEAGRPVDQLVKAGMETVQMSEIQRQKDPTLKRAVELAAAGDTRQSLAKIKDVFEINDPHSRRAAVAKAYLDLAPADRERTLIVSGTNEARREINGHVREGLGLAGKGATFDLLLRHDTTQEQRRHAANYEIGDTVQPEDNYDSMGLKRGAPYRVVDIGPKNVLKVRDEAGVEHSIAPNRCKLAVYRTVKEELAVGDFVKVTRNDAALDVANGDRFKISAIDPKHVTISDGSRELRLDATKPLHVDHAYTTTAHSSQSLTEDRTILDVDTKSPTTQKSTWYVGISRSRHQTIVYTDSVEQLPRAIKRDAVKSAALDIRRPDRAAPSYQAVLEAERAERQREREPEMARG